MKRILLYLAVSVLAFGLGITVSAALTRFYIFVDEPQPFLADISKKLPYPPCESENATCLYNLTYGEYMMRTCQFFPSVEEATSRLRTLRSGSNVILIEWSEIFNHYGDRTGESVLVFEDGSPVRLTRYSELLCTTRSGSVNDLRWFDHREIAEYR